MTKLRQAGSGQAWSSFYLSKEFPVADLCLDLFDGCGCRSDSVLLGRNSTISVMEDLLKMVHLVQTLFAEG